MRGPSESADDAEALAAELERIAVGTVGLTTRSLVEAHPGFELTFPQWRALVVLGEAAGGARIGEIAARVGTTLPATVRASRPTSPAGFS